MKNSFIIHHSFDDEPAIIFSDGAKLWCKDGNWHRDNNFLLAIIWGNGDIEFYNNGKRYWFINNKEYYNKYEYK